MEREKANNIKGFLVLWVATLQDEIIISLVFAKKILHCSISILLI